MTRAETRQPGFLITAMGDAAVMLRWRGIEAAASPRRVAAAYEAIEAARLLGVVDVVPAPASLLVRFDPAQTSMAELARRLPALVADPNPGRHPGLHEVAVRYGGEDGPDLAEVAARLGLSEEGVARRHAGRSYTVLATGFTPGFVYLGLLPPSLRLPRRPEPRLSVPAGSVALGDAQTGVYGVLSGGGWWVIGRATAPTFEPLKRPPTTFTIGDRVVFRATP